MICVKKLLGSLFLIQLVFSFSVSGRITFSHVNSSFVISDTSSTVKVTSSSTLPGWKNASIVKSIDSSTKDNYDYFTDDSGGNVREEFIFEAKQALGSISETGFLFYDRVYGDMEEVAIGGASEIWGIKRGNLYIYDINGYTQVPGQNYPWHLVDSSGMYKISAGRDGSLWAIDAAGLPYRWNVQALSWESVPAPTSNFSRFWRIVIGDRNNVWAIAEDLSSQYEVYQWNGEVWKNRSIGSWYPNTVDNRYVKQSLAVGGDGCVYGIRSVDTSTTGTGTTRDLVKWDKDTQTWSKITLKVVDRISAQVVAMLSYSLGSISVGEEGSIWANVYDPYLPAVVYSIYGTMYNAHRLVKVGSDYILRPQKVTIDFIEAGYFAEIWMRDSIRNIWYRLVGGSIRSAENYLSELPSLSPYSSDYVFPSGSSEVEDLSLMEGISLAPDAFIYVDLGLVPVASPLYLNGGTVVLKSDLYLSSSSYFGSGGRISGHGYAVVFGGNVSINSGQSLKFTTSTIIDGQNHDLILGNGAQLIVDSGVTLTLKNVTVKYVQNMTMPSFCMLAPDSQLVFKNVELALSGDYTFTQGHLFIHDDVCVTGTSKFIYESSQASFFESRSTLYFDLDTTFSYSPSNADRTLLHMKDKTSHLYLNGCTFSAPAFSNGIMFTKGSLFLENNVNLLNLNGVVPNADVSKAISFGDGVNASNDFDVFVLAGAFVVSQGYVNYNPA